MVNFRFAGMILLILMEIDIFTSAKSFEARGADWCQLLAQENC